MRKPCKRLFQALIVSLFALSLFVPAAGAAGKSFTDYHQGNFGFEEVSYLVERGVIQGYQDGSFKPHREVNRIETAIMFQRALGLEAPAHQASFKDIAPGSNFAAVAAAVKEADIFKGNSNGTFGPGDSLTREQMASVLVRAFGLQELSGKNVPLNDLHRVSSAHIKDVKILYQHGITKGKNDGSFDPKGTVSRAEFSVFMYRAINLKGPEQPIPQQDKPKITQTTITTSEGTINGTIANGSAITYDLRSLSGQTTITSGTLAVSKDSTLILTDIPSPISLVVPNGTKQELTQGNNELQLADQIGDWGIKLSTIRDFIGNFTVGAQLEDKQGNKQPITIQFLVK